MCKMLYNCVKDQTLTEKTISTTRCLSLRSKQVFGTNMSIFQPENLQPYINMHPQVVSTADVCDVTERIEGSIHCGARCCVYVEWNQTLRNNSYVDLPCLTIQWSIPEFGQRSLPKKQNCNQALLFLFVPFLELQQLKTQVRQESFSLLKG